MSDPTTPSEILARIDRDWATLWAGIETMSDGDVVAAREGDWPRNVVVMHIARWEDEWRDAVERRVADGSAKSFAGADGWSDAWAAEDGAVSPTTAKERVAGSHERFRAVLGGLAPEQWDELVTGWVNYCSYKHYQEHHADFPAP